jgi:predicted Zn-dependent protease
MQRTSPILRSASRIVRAVLLAILGAALFIQPGCKTAPITGRHQLALVGQAQMLQLGDQAYQQALSEATIERDPAINAMVQRVGTRIVQAAAVDSKEVLDFKWEFTVLKDDKTVNAWCLPGGKVAVYTGILKVTQDEPGLATVLGHEIAHATAHHGEERVSQGLLLQGGEQALGAALSMKDPQTASAVMAALGLGANVGIVLPFSRKQESEADHIGLVYMARAGYDPKEAIAFWQRMLQMAGGGSMPAFLSDHPASEQRIKDLQQELPEAEKQFRAGGVGGPMPTILPPGTIPQPEGQGQGQGQEGQPQGQGRPAPGGSPSPGPTTPGGSTSPGGTTAPGTPTAPGGASRDPTSRP